jgi:predicted SprT family Zn-dependent metalloprotease
MEIETVEKSQREEALEMENIEKEIRSYRCKCHPQTTRNRRENLKCRGYYRRY